MAVEVSGDLTLKENWERIGKFLVLNIGYVVIFTLIMIIVINMLGSNIISSFLLLVIMLSGHAIMLSSYENWRGCVIPPM